jgi:hypothetical protein
MELLWNSGMWGRRHKMSMKLLMKHFPWEVLMADVGIPMLIPAL